LSLRAAQPDQPACRQPGWPMATSMSQEGWRASAPELS